MWRIIPFAVMQSLLLCSGQVFLKFALAKMPPFAWNKDFFAALALNWQLAACGLLFGSASLVWMYILKHFPFSTAYPMASMSYVFGMVAAILFFHEEVSLQKWCGVACIILGCALIAR
jgi:undecaprenyl phosphate-alpha-L-ara4N flippase subunit ArnE